MTKPITRLCPSCRAPNLLRRKTCASCVCPLQQSGKDLQSWAKSVKANKNSHRTLESAHVSVTKLNALGYCPLLFVGRHGRKGEINGDMVHHIPVNDEVVREILKKMGKLYEHLLKRSQYEIIRLTLLLSTALEKQFYAVPKF
ncbi:unnamed protein product [Arctogadus glacialis]